MLYIKDCSKIKRFSQLPNGHPDYRLKLFLQSQEIDNSVICENIFYDLQITDCFDLNHLKNFSKKLNKIKIQTTYLHSFSGIENYSDLTCFEYVYSEGMGTDYCPKNIIVLLLCEKLTDYFIGNFGLITTILSKYMVHHKQQRKEYIMDCALDLIDAGFEDVAQL